MAKLSLVLASTSPFRKQLLQKLQLAFDCVSPEVDETPLPGESAQALVERLAIAKASAVANLYKGQPVLVIGSDQVCVNNDQILGKPGNHDKAVTQLRNASGRSIQFYTGLCVYDCRTATPHTVVEPFTVHFRKLSDEKIENYLRAEQPYQCAGSFMCEGLGIILFEALEGRDPNALVGLPLIQLVSMLERAGL